ncbi:MAG: hypothetical protein SPJ01_09900 [Butyricicoccus sp.]|nr:hypothetical protein [Butyricicoccus pullicaecorum]MCI6720636.1 hypothetical protein [Clostridiales bacterium]MDY5973158.1 hypothetical protein [Butyricicoccus sp.]
MEKQVFIINGKGGVGKDTVCSCAAQFYRVRNISSITPIVEIARFAGWNGEKTLAARRMLSQLKAVFTEFNDLSFTYCMQQYRAFEQSEDELLFIHVREPEEIARLKRAIGGVCRTLLVRRSDLAQKQYGNRSDDAVEEYPYDLYFENAAPLETLPARVHDFFEKNLK